LQEHKLSSRASKVKHVLCRKIQQFLAHDRPAYDEELSELLLECTL
jgi:hypothetical protein